MSATEKEDMPDQPVVDAEAGQQDDQADKSDKPDNPGKSSTGKGGKSSGKKANKPAEQGVAIRTVCREKCYYNNVLYKPGEPGPVFYSVIPADATHFDEVSN